MLLCMYALAVSTHNNKSSNPGQQRDTQATAAATSLYSVTTVQRSLYGVPCIIIADRNNLHLQYGVRSSYWASHVHRKFCWPKGKEVRMW